MSFDIAIGVNQSQLNASCQALMNAVPNLFGGQGTVTAFPGITVSWQATQPPIFNLAPSAVAKQAIQKEFEKTDHPLAAEILKTNSVESLADQVPSFSINFPSLEISIAQANEQATITLNITLGCLLAVDNNVISFSVLNAQFQPLTDPVANALVTYAIIPQLKASATAALNGIAIPAPTMPGVSLSPISAAIVNGMIIACTNISSNGPSSLPPTNFSWPTAGFFLLLGQNALQAAVSSVAGSGKTFQGSSTQGSDWGEVHYGYTLNISAPTVQISSTNLLLNFGISGNLNAGLKVCYVPIGINYDISANPTPQATFSPQVTQSNTLNIVFETINAFVFLLNPSGSAWEKIVSGITWPITQAWAAIVEPLTSLFIKNIMITAYNLPVYPVTIQGQKVSFIPSIQAIANCAGNLSFTGSLIVQ